MRTGASGSSAVAGNSGGRFAARVHEGLKARLVSGEFPPGGWIRVEAIKQDFGVSRQPVMDALRMLQAEGFVEIMPQIGCRAATYSAREVRDFFTMFGGIEGLIAAAAAGRRTDTQLASLRAVSARIGGLRDLDDVEGRTASYLELNREFHAIVYAMADSRVMSQMSKRMWDLSDFLIKSTGSRESLSSALDYRHRDHELMLAAIEIQDGVTARREPERHIAETAQITHPAKPDSGSGRN